MGRGGEIGARQQISWCKRQHLALSVWDRFPSASHCFSLLSVSLDWWRKEIYYLTTNSTLYLRLYGVRHMVKDHSDSERGNPLPPHRLLFQISSKGSFICIIPQTGQYIPRPFVTPAVEHWVEREIAQWIRPMKDRSDDPSHHERTLLPRSYISLLLHRWINGYINENK